MLRVSETQVGTGTTAQKTLETAPTVSSTSAASRVMDGTSDDGSRIRKRETWTYAALVVLTIVGAIIRARTFVGTGLNGDDAWVALSSKVGLGTAWHMWATIPGFGFIERTWMILGPNDTWWYQLPDYVCGVAAVPVTYFLARYFRLGRGAALAVAVVVCTSPICVEYSTRVKEYPFDFLLSCLLLALAEAARRRPERRPLLGFAAASAAAFLVSASLGTVVVGLWVALVVAARRDRAALRRVLVVGAASAVACGIFAAVFYSHLSPQLKRYWRGYFIKHSSLYAFASSSVHTAKNLLDPNLLGLPSVLSTFGFGLVLVIICLAFSLVALVRDPAMLAPALAVLASFVASAAQVVPLGTGRTDECLYPALLMLIAVGATQVLGPVGAALMRTTTGEGSTMVIIGVGLASMLVAGVLVLHAYDTVFVYPRSDVQKLATELHRAERPGDHVFVSLGFDDYSWAFYEVRPVRVEFTSKEITDFRVASTKPNVFIGSGKGKRYVREAQAMATADQRVWYVGETTKDRHKSATYRVFLRDGWDPVQTIHAYRCSASLLVRSTRGAGPASTPPSSTGRIPTAPTGITAVSKKPGKLKVKFTVGASIGGTATRYRALCTSSNGGVVGSMTGTGSPIKVKGLTAGDRYTCTVTASNARGTGLPSAASATVTA